MPTRESRHRKPEDRYDAFEDALRYGGYAGYGGSAGGQIQEVDPRWPAYVNADVLDAYEADPTDFLDRDRFVLGFLDGAFWRLQNGGFLDGLPSVQAYREAGNTLKWATRLGIVGEETRAGVRGWVLLNPRPIWILDNSRPGRRMLRTQGGTPAEQAEYAAWLRMNATRQKTRATLARKACIKATADIGRLLTRILEAEPTFRVTENWCASGYVPGAFARAYLSACSPTVRDACVEGAFSANKLREWMGHLSYLAGHLEEKALMRRRAAEEAARREDDQALAELGGL